MTDTSPRIDARTEDEALQAHLDEDGHPLPAEPAPARARRRQTPVEAFFHRFFALFYNKKIGLFLILAMAILTLIGVLAPQVPADVRADDAAYADWLRDVRGTFGGWTPVLSALGVFSMFTSIQFKIATVLLALSIIGCTVHRMPLLWRNATRPHLHVTDGFFEHAKVSAQVEVQRSPQETLEAMRRILISRRHRVLDDPKGAGFALYADRFRWMPFGTALAHAAFVILLIGMLVTNNSGFSESLPVTVGNRVPVGHDTGLEIEARGFRDTYYASGQPMDYVSDVVLYEHGREVAHQDVRVNSPLRHGNVKIHQAFFGTSAVVDVKDARGASVYSGGVPLQFTSDDEQNSIGRLDLPGTDLLLFVITPASGQVQSEIPAGQAQAQIEKKGVDDPIAGGRLVAGQPTTVGDYTITFQREAKFAGLMVNQDFGAPWVWTGSALLMIGMTATMGFKHRRVWVRVRPSESGTGTQVVAASSDKADLSFQRWFRDLGDELRALDGPDGSVPASSTTSTSTTSTESKA